MCLDLRKCRSLVEVSTLDVFFCEKLSFCVRLPRLGITAFVLFLILTQEEERGSHDPEAVYRFICYLCNYAFCCECIDWLVL